MRRHGSEESSESGDAYQRRTTAFQRTKSMSLRDLARQGSLRDVVAEVRGGDVYADKSKQWKIKRQLRMTESQESIHEAASSGLRKSNSQIAIQPPSPAPRDGQETLFEFRDPAAPQTVAEGGKRVSIIQEVAESSDRDASDQEERTDEDEDAPQRAPLPQPEPHPRSPVPLPTAAERMAKRNSPAPAAAAPRGSPAPAPRPASASAAAAVPRTSPAPAPRPAAQSAAAPGSATSERVRAARVRVEGMVGSLLSELSKKASIPLQL